MDTMRWQHCLVLAAGAWLMSSPWALNALGPPVAPTMNAIVVVAALMVFGALVQVLRLRARLGQALLLGIWALIAVIALESARTAIPLILVGFVALAIVAWATLIDKETRQRQRRRRV